MMRLTREEAKAHRDRWSGWGCGAGIALSEVMLFVLDWLEMDAEISNLRERCRLACEDCGLPLNCQSEKYECPLYQERVRRGEK